MLSCDEQFFNEFKYKIIFIKLNQAFLSFVSSYLTAFARQGKEQRQRGLLLSAGLLPLMAISVGEGPGQKPETQFGFPT